MAIKVGNSTPAPEYLPVGQSMWAVISHLLLFKATVTKQGAGTFVLEGTNDGGSTFTNIFTLTLDGTEVIGTVVNSAKLSMTFEKVRFSKSTGTGPLVIYTDDTYSSSNIEVCNSTLRNLVAGGPAVRIMPGSGFAVASSKTKDVLLYRVETNCASGPSILVDSKIRKLTINSCLITPSDSDSTACVQVTTNGTVDTLEFANIDFEGGAWPVTVRGHFCDISGVARNIIFRNCTWRGASGFFRVLNVATGSTVESIVFENCEADTIDGLVTHFLGIPVTIRGGRYNAVSSGVNFKVTGGKLIIEGNPVFINMNLGVARCDTASTTTEIVDRSNARYSGTTVPFAVLNGALVNIRAPNMSVDIGATGVNKASGNEVFNTTLRGTIPANVPVICDGTNWYNKCNLSQTF